MGKKMLLLVVLMAVCLCGSAFALDPMGPPTAGLTQGQWSAGLDYAFSETDLDFDGKFGESFFFWTPFDSIEDKLTFEAVEMHKGYLNIGYGITDEVDVFVRVGGARAETIKPTRDIYTEGYDEYDYYYDQWIGEDGVVHDFDAGFALGFGAKATVWEDTNLKIGVLGQASWTELDVRVKYQGLYDMYIDYYPYGSTGIWSVPSEGELEFWEMQLAVGATYQLSPGFSIYGGPFFYWLDGDYDFKGEGIFAEDGDLGNPGYLGVKGSYDVENDSQFGGYLGAQIEVTGNVACRAECMLTGDAIGFGTGLTWLF